MPVSVGEAFTLAQRRDIERAVNDAERLCGRVFSVHVGHAEGDPRQLAEALHAQLEDPDNSILIHVDPTLRALEIVTGSAVRARLDNRSVALAAIGMQSAFAAGELTNGILTGLQQLAEMARPAETLHINP